MPFRICKTFEIESGHMLSKHPGKCKFPHGHSRTIEFVLEADSLDENEMVCDFSLIKQVMNPLLEEWDHSMCMNTRDPLYTTLNELYETRIVDFDGIDPTTEVMAKTIYERFASELRAYSGQYPLRPAVRIVKVRVSETSSSWAEYL